MSKLERIGWFSWSITKAILSAVKHLLSNRKYIPLLTVCILYSIIAAFGSFILWDLLRTPADVPPREFELLTVTEHFWRGYLKWTVILAVPIYGLGIEIARRQLSQNDQPIRFWGWKRRTRIGAEVMVIFLLCLYLPDVILTAITFGLSSHVLAFSEDFAGFNLTESGFYRIFALSTGLFILPSLLLNYIHREQLSDLFPLDQYILILQDRTYIALSVAFIVSLLSPMWLMTTIYYPALPYEDLLDAYPLIVAIIVILVWLGWPAIGFVIGLLLAFCILGQNARSVRSLMRTRKTMCDPTMQTKLNQFKRDSLESSVDTQTTFRKPDR